MAFPFDKAREEIIYRALPSLKKLNFKVFLVDEKGNVSVL